jgi:hypothetical protein
VERSNGYLETSFLPLREFADLADLPTQSDAWTADTAWRRYHRRLGARVFEALAVERAELTPLPAGNVRRCVCSSSPVRAPSGRARRRSAS